MGRFGATQLIEGYGIVIGCLVRVSAGRGRPWNGWVREIDEARRLLGLICDRRGGGIRYACPGQVTVRRPSLIDEARQIGNAKVQREVSEQAHRRAGLRRRV